MKNWGFADQFRNFFGNAERGHFSNLHGSSGDNHQGYVKWNDTVNHRTRFRGHCAGGCSTGVAQPNSVACASH
jgi:hypothetical protein